ncbi:MAG TPA: hypothetical protein VG324_20100 [Blastocatellia bacterium]|nr:hypothetical protein [Blastocatellia bacterium]
MITKLKIGVFICVYVAAGALALAVPLAARPNPAPERFTAFALNLKSPRRAMSGRVEIVVNRWSTDEERDRLLAVLLEKGPEKLLDVLQDTPRVGYIRTPNSICYDLKFSRRTPGEDGVERIEVITGRDFRFWEVINQPGSIDYSFAVIELRINRNGQGEGQMSLATKITGKALALEDYATQPVSLQKARRERN